MTDAPGQEGRESMKRPARAHILALLSALATIVAVSALWIVNLRLGPRLEGFTAGPMVIFVPFAMVVLTAFWLFIRGALHGRLVWTTVMVLGWGLGLSLVTVAAYCGPVACFVPGNNRLMGWFVVGGVTLAALIHHLVLNAFSGERSHALET
jgi:hypothetical protein